MRGQVREGAERFPERYLRRKLPAGSSATGRRFRKYRERNRLIGGFYPSDLFAIGELNLNRHLRAEIVIHIAL
jgi:hypothetical protein